MAAASGQEGEMFPSSGLSLLHGTGAVQQLPPGYPLRAWHVADPQEAWAPCSSKGSDFD